MRIMFKYFSLVIRMSFLLHPFFCQAGDLADAISIGGVTKEKIDESCNLLEEKRIKRHIEYLASDDLEGRKVGTMGNQKAAEYIARYFEYVNLKPVKDTYFQHFSFIYEGKKIDAKNVLGLYEGSDENLKNQILIVSAHFDHLGKGEGQNSGEDVIYNGADDNASGVSAMLEIAQAFYEVRYRFNLRPKRTILFLASDGEEEGMEGAKYFMRASDLKNFVVAINLDTIGRNSDKPLIIEWSDTSPTWRQIIKKYNQNIGLDIRFERNVPGESDAHIFISYKIPTFDIFSGYHEDYHKVSDHADKIDISRVKKVACLVFKILFDIANTPDLPKWQDPYTPTLIDELGLEVLEVGLSERQDYKIDKGAVRVIRVRTNSVAERSGLEQGDIIVEVGGQNLPDQEPENKMKDIIRSFMGRNENCITLKVLRNEKNINLSLCFK